MCGSPYNLQILHVEFTLRLKDPSLYKGLNSYRHKVTLEDPSPLHEFLPAAIIKHHDQGTLKKNGSIIPGGWVGHGEEPWQQTSWWCQEEEDDSSHQPPSRKQREQTGMTVINLSNPDPSDIFPLTRLYLLNLPQNSATTWGSGVQVSEPLGDIFFKPLYPQSQRVSEPHKPPTFRIFSIRALAPGWISSSQVASTEWSFSGRIFPDHLMRTEAGKCGSLLHWPQGRF